MGFLGLGGSDKPKVRQYDLWNSGQKRIFGDLESSLRQPVQTNPQLANLFSTSLTGLEQYAQSIVAAQPEQTQQQGQLRDQGTQTLMDMMTKGPQDIDEYFTQSVMQPMLEMFKEDIMPSISRNYAPSGFYSSQRLNADQRAQEELLQALTQSRAQMAYTARESDLTRALQASGMAMNQQGQDVQSMMNLFGGAAQVSQATSPEEAARLRQQQMMLQALGLTPRENVVMAPQGGDTWGSALSGIGQAAMGGAQLWSMFS